MGRRLRVGGAGGAIYANVPGNYYDKYNTRNPIARHLMRGFLRAFDRMTGLTGVQRAYEVGCGEGNLALRLLDKGWEVRGSDVEPRPVAEANAQARARGNEPLFEVANLYDLDPESVASELVVCCEVLEHLPDPDRALRLLRRMARPYLLVSVPREPLWRILNVSRGRYLTALGNTPGHINHWSRGSFIDLLSRHADVLACETPLPWTMALCRCG